MKTTKVLGFVLGALLVAGLFVGAAAAEDTSLGDVEVYKLYGNVTSKELFPVSGILFADNATWTSELGSVTFLKETGVGENKSAYYIAGENIVPGKYYRHIGNVNYFINVKYPTAQITGTIIDSNGDEIAQLIGNTVDNAKTINITYTGALAFTNPAGTLTSKNLSTFGADYAGAAGAPYKYNITALDLGEWTVQAVFQKGVNNGFSSLAPDFMYGEKYYFTVVKEVTDASISTDATEIIQGGYATIVIEAPTGVWNVSVGENAIIPDYQAGVKLTNTNRQTANVTVPVSGIAKFTLKAETTSNIKVILYEKGSDSAIESTLTIKVKAATITAEADTASVYIGNEVDLSGTNEIGGTLYFYVKGTNYKFSEVADNGATATGGQLTAAGKEWTATLKTADMNTTNGKKPDAGTYTIYAASLADGKKGGDVKKVEDLDNSSIVKAYTTVSLALKQPFITITSAPEVVTHGDKLVVKGTAEGQPDNVMFYIFGTNAFENGTVSVESDGTFEISEKVVAPDKDGGIKLAAGQYFLVIQHKMYDGKYNIGPMVASAPNKGYNIVLNESGSYFDGTSAVIFNTNVRQSANAAEALCRALDSQNIDDMYVKASFIVAGATSFIDPVPTTVTKGEVLTISGTATGHKDDIVSVELLSTAFAAIPKEAVGSASFVALSTKIDESGVWSISFDTSALNADEYTCSVAVGQLDATTSKITVVEGAGPQPTETTPVNPTVAPTAQPTATPATPGFGALAALAGLGAVAVLLLRRE